MDATLDPQISFNELNEVKKRAVVLVAQGMRNKDVATAVDRDEHTIARWKQEPAFIEAVKAAGEAMDAQ